MFEPAFHSSFGAKSVPGPNLVAGSLGSRFRRSSARVGGSFPTIIALLVRRASEDAVFARSGAV